MVTNVSKSNIISDISGQITYVVKSFLEEHGDFKSFEDLKSYLIDQINITAVKHEMVPIKNEIVNYKGKNEKIDLVLYKEEVSFLSIEFSWYYIGHSIAKLLANETENRLLISVYKDKSLPQNMLKRFDRTSNI